MKTKKFKISLLLTIIMICLSIVPTKGQIDTLNPGIDTVKSGITTLLLQKADIYEIYRYPGLPITLKIDIFGASNFVWHDNCSGNCETDSITIDGENEALCDFEVGGQGKGVQCHIHLLPDTCPPIDTVNAYICDGQYHFCGGELQNISGLYFDTLSAANGCDSIVFTDLIVFPAYVDTNYVSICNGQSYLAEGLYQTNPGIYRDNFYTTHSCDSTIFTVLTVNVPNANFTTDTNDLSVEFLAADSANSLFWDFGDGETSNDKTPIHIYSVSGYYHVCLTAHDTSMGCQNSWCNDILVGDTATCCIAEFIYEESKKGQSISFTDSSKGNPNKWYWKFGDGNSSAEQHPKHSYTASGIYTTRLTIFNENTGCMSNYDKTIEITGSTDCKSTFTYSVNVKKKIVTFTSLPILTAENKVISYIWDFGDGETSNDANPIHTYKSDNFYSVCLSITTSNGCYNTDCKNIQVGNNVCKGYFQWTISDSTQNLVSFKDKSIGTINDWKWNFGDGGHSSIQNPDHQYGGQGFYHVHLNIKGSGCVSHYNDVVAIQSIGLTGRFAYLPDSTSNLHKSGYQINFFGAFWGEPSQFIWEFGDGTTDSLQQYPTHTYADTGTYNVCLNVSRSLLGQYDKYCRDIKVEEIITNSSLVPQSSSLTIYPNPAKDFIIITATNKQIKFEIYDALGQIVLTQNNYKGDLINISNLKAGIYFLLVTQSDGNKIARKLIKE